MQCAALAIRDSLWQVKAIRLFPSPQTLRFDARFSWLKPEGLGLMAKVFSAQFLSYASTVWKHCYRFRNLSQNDVIPKMSTALRTILLHDISFDIYSVRDTLTTSQSTGVCNIQGENQWGSTIASSWCLKIKNADYLLLPLNYDGVGGMVLWSPHTMRKGEESALVTSPEGQAASHLWPLPGHLPITCRILTSSPGLSTCVCSHAENFSPRPHKRMLQPSCVGCHTFRKFRKINLLFKEKEMYSEHFWSISKTTACSVWISQRPAQLIPPWVKKFISPNKRMESLSLHKENFCFSI